jgi:hypothetical protein
VPRTVVLLRGGLAALVVALLPAMAAPARAETLSVAVAADPVAGQPSGVDYEYDTGTSDLSVTLLVRPASGPPCGATAVIDGALVGASGGATYVTPTPIMVEGHGGGRVPFTFSSPGPVRVCGWLARTPDDVAATAVADADVRLPRASLTLSAQEIGAKAGGADVAVRATGESEAPADLYVTAVPGGSVCPPTYGEDTDPTALDPSPAGTPTRVSGAFDLRFETRALLSLRSWRICGYLQDGTTAEAASATGSTPVNLVLRPTVVRRPRVRRQGGALTCDGGRWKARPSAAYRYTWLAGSRPIPRATKRRLAVGGALRGAAIRCRVTARNRLGATTATSRPVRA